MAPKIKINLKDRFEDGELDLSMSDLQEVPVKEIATVKKATSLDLSNNRLSTLGKNFITLTHIIKLDLSKNQLVQLPEDFGEMRQLKHLDLYSNQITHLPLSFCELRNLRWLDLKNNPLAPAVARVIGPCLDAAQCQAGARAAVQLYTEMRAQVEEERELRRQQEARAHEQQLEKEKQQRKRNDRKKAARQKRKEINQQQQQVLEERKMDTTEPTGEQRKHQKGVSAVDADKIAAVKSGGIGRTLVILAVCLLPLLFLASAGGLLGEWWDEKVLGGLGAGWQRCERSLPEGAAHWARSFAAAIASLHSSAARLLDDISTTLTELPHTNATMELVSHALSAAANHSQIIFRTLSEKLMLITDEITRKLI